MLLQCNGTYIVYMLLGHRARQCFDLREDGFPLRSSVPEHSGYVLVWVFCADVAGQSGRASFKYPHLFHLVQSTCWPKQKQNV